MLKKMIPLVMAVLLLSGCGKQKQVYQTVFLDVFDTVTTLRGYETSEEAFQERAEQVQAFLTVFSEIERQYYPVNAKYHLKAIEGVLDSAFARVKPESGLTETFRDEVRQLHLAARVVRDTLCQG